eukprot:8225770-Ditylum_brightwellii.AAC.1
MERRIINNTTHLPCHGLQLDATMCKRTELLQENAAKVQTERSKIVSLDRARNADEDNTFCVSPAKLSKSCTQTKQLNTKGESKRDQRGTNNPPE